VVRLSQASGYKFIIDPATSHPLKANAGPPPALCNPHITPWVSNQDQRFATDHLIDLITIARGVVASEFGGF
jgi:hypothetical protein